MHRIRLFPLVVLFTPLAWGAGGTLVLSSGAASGSTASLSLVLASVGSQPAGIQWTVTYPSGNILSVSASAAGSSANAGKTISCAGSSGTYTCILAGRNASVIPDGIVASLNVTLAPGIQIASLGLTNTQAATFDGQMLALTGIGGAVVSAGVTPPTTPTPPSLTGLSCTPSTLASGAAGSCTVTLSGTGGGTVTLGSNNAALTVPPSVTVSAAATTATFTATAGSFTSNSTATVTASMGTSTQTASIALSASITISALACAPATLAAGAVSTCTVSLSKVGGGTVTLGSNNAALTVPPSVTVSAAATTATFTATAGSFTSNSTAIVTAGMGTSTQTASITLSAPITISALACAPSFLTAGAISTCTVTVSKTGGATVNLASDNAALTVPPSVNVGATSTTATFTATAGNIAANQTANVWALLTGSSQAAAINLVSGQNDITSLPCLANTRLSRIDCTIQLTRAATDDGITVTLQSNSSRLQMPGPVSIGGGQQSATFHVRVVPSDQDAQLSFTASIPGASRTTTIAVTGTRPTALNFSANSVQAGSILTGEIRMSSSNVLDTVVLNVISSSPDVLVPSSVAIKPGATRVTFLAMASARSKQQNAQISVSFGQTTALATLNVLPSTVPVLSVPHEILARYGEETSFTVSGFDPQLLPLVYSVDTLPAGAHFDDATGSFSWTPDPSQQGTYDVVFTATNAARSSSVEPVRIVVGSGQPAITGVANAASAAAPVCSAGSLATVRGRWLTTGGGSASDPSASGVELAGSRVRINGAYAPVVYASPDRIDFVCPAPGQGTALSILVESAAGASDSVAAAMAPVAPGLFTLDGTGTGQGLAYLADADTPALAIARDYQELGHPAQPGDLISVRATGIGSPDDLPPVVMLGGLIAEVNSVRAVPGMAGVSEITIRVPPGVAEGNIDLVVVYRDPAAAGGIVHHPSKTGIRSNTVTVAVELPQ